VFVRYDINLNVFKRVSFSGNADYSNAQRDLTEALNHGTCGFSGIERYNKFEVERKTVVMNLKTNEANSNSRKKPIGIIKRMIDI